MLAWDKKINYGRYKSAEHVHLREEQRLGDFIFLKIFGTMVLCLNEVIGNVAQSFDITKKQSLE